MMPDWFCARCDAVNAPTDRWCEECGASSPAAPPLGPRPPAADGSARPSAGGSPGVPQGSAPPLPQGVRTPSAPPPRGVRAPSAGDRTPSAGGRPCPHDGTPLRADGYCAFGLGWPLAWACPFQCDRCARPLTWSGICLYCLDALGERVGYAPGNRYETTEANPHWRLLAPGPQEMPTYAQGLAWVRCLAQALTPVRYRPPQTPLYPSDILRTHPVIPPDLPQDSPDDDPPF
jgi:hypothetical protein